MKNVFIIFFLLFLSGCTIHNIAPLKSIPSSTSDIIQIEPIETFTVPIERMIYKTKDELTALDFTLLETEENFEEFKNQIIKVAQEGTIYSQSLAIYKDNSIQKILNIDYNGEIFRVSYQNTEETYQTESYKYVKLFYNSELVFTNNTNVKQGEETNYLSVYDNSKDEEKELDSYYNRFKSINSSVYYVKGSYVQELKYLLIPNVWDHFVYPRKNISEYYKEEYEANHINTLPVGGSIEIYIDGTTLRAVKGFESAKLLNTHTVKIELSEIEQNYISGSLNCGNTNYLDILIAIG